MCGITGKFAFRGERVDPSLIERMNGRLVHRGPDDSGVHCAGPIGLGQRRLAIIDLGQHGTAPLCNEDRTVWVTFNGEIYNYRELRNELECSGHRFATRTDTEVLVHLYEEMGVGCVERLRGMFAFAIWDGVAQKLLLGRDRLGQKPLFYHHCTSGLLFASEIKALLPEAEVSRSPNLEAIDAYLTLQYVPAPVCAFEGVRKLPAGHLLICERDGSMRVRRYWEPKWREKTRESPDSIRDSIRVRLREAVRMRMVADVDVGVLLSGGIDSGAVVALMAEESTRPIRTFSIGVEGFGSMNELPYARMVAERYGTEHHELVVRPEAASILPTLVRQYDEPFADSSAIPTFYVAQMARQAVTVALAGDGGDESFAGYRRYARMVRWSCADVVPEPVRRGIFGSLQTTARNLPAGAMASRAEVGFQMLASSMPSRYRLYRSVFKPQDKRRGYADPLLRVALKSRYAIEEELPRHPEESALGWMMRDDQAHYLAQCLNTKVDIASMANSLEVRAPFQDHLLVEYAATIPPKLQQDGSRTKAMLRDAMSGLLPREIVEKPKTGFAIPVADWLRGELSGLLTEMLLDGKLEKRGLFNHQFVDGLVRQHRSGARDWSVRLWSLLWLEMWFRSFID